MRLAVATLFGIGRVPFMPGTLGSIAGAGISWWLAGQPRLQAAACAAVILLALWSAGSAERILGKKDPSCIVIDEVAGMMVAVLFLPAAGAAYGVGFVLFRFLDIVKPPPLRWFQRLPGSWGILLDDLLAGLMVRSILCAAQAWMR